VYNAFFGFQKDPFASTPDPEFFFRSKQHDAALKGLLMSVDARMGLISLVGDEGTGKTVVLECLRNSLGPEIPCAFLRDSRITFGRFLETIASDLHLRSKTKSAPQVFLALTRLATQQAQSGSTVVLIVDEAHNLRADVFDDIVHIASLHHDKVKAIQTVFAGRPELQPRLAALNSDRINQRAVLSRSLYPFTARETQEYIEFRLACAGMPKQTVFPRKALEEIYDRSQGFAPAIHALCERLLLSAFSATSKVCTQEIRDQVFKKPHRNISQIMEDAPIAVAAARIYHSLLAPPPAPEPEPPPMQTALLRIAVDARLGSLRPRPVSTDERPAHLAAIRLPMAFPRGKFALAGVEFALGPIQPMPPEDFTKAAVLRPSMDLGSVISSMPVAGLLPRLPKAAAAEDRLPGASHPPAYKLIPLDVYVKLKPALTGAPAPAGPFPELFSHALQPICPRASLQPASVIPGSRVPLAPIRTTKYDPLPRTAASADPVPLSFTGIPQPTHPTAALQPASIIPCSLVPLVPFRATGQAPLPPSASRSAEMKPANLIPAGRPAETILSASLHPSVWGQSARGVSVGGPSTLLPLTFSAQPIPPPAETPIGDLSNVQASLYLRPPTLRLKPAEPSRPSLLSPSRWIPHLASLEIPWASPADTFAKTRKRLASHPKPLLALVIPILAALALYGAPPAMRAAADASRQGWQQTQRAVLNRAAVALDEDFRAGMGDWTNQGGSPPFWTSDASGFVRPGALALYRPSLGMVDYQMQFLGTIDKKGLSWVARAADFNNYYAIRLTVLKPGPLPLIGVSRYAVIHGVPQRQFTTPLLMRAQADTVYRVRLDIRGDRFALSIQDQPVDSWSEPRLGRGSIGFFSEKDAGSRIASLHVRGHYDMLGRLCAFLMPSIISNYR
jgi:general secretion pathway protein A